MQRLQANKAERRSHIQPKINFDVKSADVHETDGQVVFRFEQWDLNRPDSLTEMYCVCICPFSYLLSNTRHLFSCISKEFSATTAESSVRNEMFPAQDVGWTSSYLWWFGWMVIWGQFVSQTKIWDFCGKKKNYLSIFKSMFSYFIHAAVMQQQIQEQLEAVSCHSINCSKWMSSRRQTEAKL